MFVTSVCTRGIFSPARNVLSTTAPDSSAFSLVRTNAPPLPGLTCWNSTMRQTVPSSSMCMPFLNWFVEIMSAAAPYPSTVKSLGYIVSRSPPVAVTMTRSSIRTPPRPGR